MASSRFTCDRNIFNGIVPMLISQMIFLNHLRSATWQLLHGHIIRFFKSGRK